VTWLLLLLLQELLRGGTNLPGHYHWKIIRKLMAISPAQIASHPLPRHTQGHGGLRRRREGGLGRKEGEQSIPQKGGNELERGGWSSTRTGCGFDRVGFFLVIKSAPPLRIFFFFFFISFIHELLTILFSKSVYPNDLSLLQFSRWQMARNKSPLNANPDPACFFTHWTCINMPSTAPERRQSPQERSREGEGGGREESETRQSPG